MQSMIVIAFQIVGSLCFFLYGMKVMSSGIQKSAGDRLEAFFNKFASNRYLGWLIGLVVTTAVQSSSATTVMVVSFANIGAVKLQQAISLIMGANVGTTTTAWIVSMFGFKFKIVEYMIPLMAIGFPLMFSKRDSRRGFGEFIVGGALLFIGLEMLKDSIPTLDPDLVARFTNFDATNLLTVAAITIIGMLVTEIVQSSSASTTICLTLVAKGVISFEMALPFMLGANIGTTITAYLASIGTTLVARRVAWAHITFNVIGATVWVLAYGLVIPMIVNLCAFLGVEDDTMRLAVFHTAFNMFWSIVYLSILPQYTKLIEKLVPGKRGEIQEVTADNYHFDYNDATFQSSPEIILSLAKREIVHMANIIKNMASAYVRIFNAPLEDRSDDVELIMKAEKLIDVMQERIGEFLVKCSQTNLRNNNKHNIAAFLTVVNSLESVADDLENMTKVCKLRYKDGISMRVGAQEELNAYFTRVANFLDFLSTRLNKHLSSIDLKEAETIEKGVNSERNRLRLEVENALSSGKETNVKGELLILDTVRYTEKIGDHFMAIANALRSITKA